MRQAAKRTSTFGPEDGFYLKVGLANAPDDTKVKAAWTAVAAEGAEANTPLDDVELDQRQRYPHLRPAKRRPWPAGDYKVDIYLNGKLDRSLRLRVAALSQAPPPHRPSEPAAPTPEPAPSSLAVNSLQGVQVGHGSDRVAGQL